MLLPGRRAYGWAAVRRLQSFRLYHSCLVSDACFPTTGTNRAAMEIGFHLAGRRYRNVPARPPYLWRGRTVGDLSERLSRNLGGLHRRTLLALANFGPAPASNAFAPGLRVGWSSSFA